MEIPQNGKTWVSLLSYLFFVDDLTFFAEASNEKIQIIKELFWLFMCKLKTKD